MMKIPLNPPFSKGGKGGFESGSSHESKFIEILCAGLTETPEGCSTILISRTAPPPTLARFWVNQEIKVVGRDEMLLSDDEFAGIAKVLGYKIGNREKVAHLQKAIKGWTAGLILMIERSRAGIADKQCLLSGIADHRVFDYFMSEI